MNWGHKITIVIILFVVGMLSMVFIAMRQTNEMIDDNYYQKELEYQEIIDASQNLQDLSSNNLVSQTLTEVVITLPPGTFEKVDSGLIELLRTDEERRDVVMDMKRIGSNRYVFSKNPLKKGIYKARIKWTNEGIPYYKEESVFVEK